MKENLEKSKEESEENLKYQTKLKAELDGLKKSIADNKINLKKLEEEATTITNDLKIIKEKFARAETLTNSLSVEKSRWQEKSSLLENEIKTIKGDIVLCSAFMAYGGFFDQNMRKLLFDSWKDCFPKDLNFDNHIKLVHYLSNADKQFEWSEFNLPRDEFCFENAIILENVNRCPLIIDPSGQATTFISNMYKDSNIKKTSFLNKNFIREFKNSIHNGFPIIIEDAENYDPILNSVLKISKTHRNLLFDGNNVQVPHLFKLFLTTRDPNIQLTPDLYSRVTIINFTITRASLQEQLLNKIFKHESPALEEKRLILSNQNESYKKSLRQLETELLEVLSENFNGSILENDNVIRQLEKIKEESKTFDEKNLENEKNMEQVTKQRKMYSGLAEACSNIYFKIICLNHLHVIYQYSLEYFLEIFNATLTDNGKLNEIKDKNERLKSITDSLFEMVYLRLARGMLEKDRIVLAVLLSKIYSKSIENKQNIENELESILKNNNSSSEVLVNKKQQHMENTANITTFRPDYFKKEAASNVFSESFLTNIDKNIDYENIIKNEIRPSTPIIMCSMPGYDASGLVEKLAAKNSFNLISFSIGSNTEAKEILKTHSKSDDWVLIKNIHMASTHFLVELENELNISSDFNLSFRLFLSMELNTKMPTNLLKASR